VVAQVRGGVKEDEKHKKCSARHKKVYLGVMICFELFKTAFFEFSENPLLLIGVPSASGVQLLLDVIADLKA
jgi:hypothetical protein